MTPRDAGPTGLGGWLWPVTWLSAMWPVAWLALAVDALRWMWGWMPSLWALGEPWHFVARMTLLFPGAAFAVWWAARWFARDPRLPRRAPWLLWPWALIITPLAWPQPRASEYAIVALAWSAVVLAWWASRHSMRVRNTFVAGPIPPRGHGVSGVLRGGPVGWDGLRWLIPGVLGYAAARLAFELPVSIEAAMEAIPVVPPAGGAGPLVHDPTRYILASRVVLGLQVAALLTLLAAFVALARGWRSLPLLTIATLLLALGAPLRMVIRDWCCPFVDGPAFESHVVSWLVALALAVIGALAWRRPRATPHAE